MSPRMAHFSIGDVVRHKRYAFRGVIFDVDPVFANSEEWWLSISARPAPDQRSALLPFICGERGDDLCRLRFGAEPSIR